MDKKSVALAQELIKEYAEVLGCTPNIRHILFTCASDQMTPSWIRERHKIESEKAKQIGNTALLEKFEKVEEAREEFMYTVLLMFESILKRKGEGIDVLKALDNNLSEGVAHMKQDGALPRPFI